MKSLIFIKDVLQTVWWFMNDRCYKCGGEVKERINGKHYCMDCGSIN